MRLIGPDEVHAALDPAALIESLRVAFAAGDAQAPARESHDVGTPEAPARLLSMPAWRRGAAIGVKLVNVFPGNAALGFGAVHAVYVLFDGATGRPRALIDGEALTNRRTAAASALASSYLSRANSRVLLVVGTGHVAARLPAAHRAVRPIEKVLVWGRSPEKAAALAAKLRAEALPAIATDDLAGAVGQADIVSCATTAVEPLVFARDVAPGTHVDLVVAFTPNMRECDDALVACAAVYVDTRAGELVQAAASGIWSPAALAGDLHELCSNARPGRTQADEITLFKSVGTALEDLVAAELVVGGPSGPAWAEQGRRA